jgi:Glycosyltransferase family 87
VASRESWVYGERGDVLLYVVSAALAVGLAVVTIYHGHRVWGVVSAVAYAGGAAATALARRPARHTIAAAVFVTSALVPLAVLVVQRAHGVAWSAQPEVDVVERMARLLVHTGTPYGPVHGLVRFEDYSPYLPAMSVFGLPRAAFDSPLTDARLVFAAVSALLLVHATRMLGTSTPPVRAVQLVAVLPATTLAVATGGDDLPVLALLVLSCVAVHRRQAVTAGLAGGLALAMKLTAAPVLLVLAVALWVAAGARRAVAFAAIAAGVAVALVLPAAVASPGALLEHVIRFPAGMTGVESPAASPLPGHLLAQTGPAGRALALALLALAALAVLAWVALRPPTTAAQAAERAAAGLGVAMLLMPATRFGYLIYPLVLTGTAIALKTGQKVTGMPVTNQGQPVAD